MKLRRKKARHLPGFFVTRGYSPVDNTYLNQMNAIFLDFLDGKYQVFPDDFFINIRNVTQLFQNQTGNADKAAVFATCLLYTSPSPRDRG